MRWPRHTTLSVARVALAWMLTKPFVTSIIIGAKNRQQLGRFVWRPGGCEAAARGPRQAGRGQRPSPGVSRLDDRLAEPGSKTASSEVAAFRQPRPTAEVSRALDGGDAVRSTPAIRARRANP